MHTHTCSSQIHTCVDPKGRTPNQRMNVDEARVYCNHSACVIRLLQARVVNISSSLSPILQHVVAEPPTTAARLNPNVTSRRGVQVQASPLPHNNRVNAARVVALARHRPRPSAPNNDSGDVPDERTKPPDVRDDFSCFSL